MKSNLVLQLDGRIFPDPNNNADDKGDTQNDSSKDKYKLRPRAGKGESRTSVGPARAAPLSKYRRRTANARERSRMREINSAFEALRRCVPGGAGAPTVPERLTKISTLRLATQYIATLAAALASPQQPSQSCPFDLFDVRLEDVAPSPSSAFSSDLPDTFCSASVSSEFSLSPDFPDDSLSPFDPFLTDFS